MYQNKTEGKVFNLDEATTDTKPSDYYTVETDLYPSISDIVNAVYGMALFMSGAGPHIPKFHYDTVGINTLMIYSDIVEYSIVGDTKAAILRCIPFISKVTYGRMISTGQNMNCQNFSICSLKDILKLIPQHKTRGILMLRKFLSTLSV